MALVDFHQLAILYKLGCEDAGVLSNPPNPPQMYMNTRSKSRSKANGSSSKFVVPTRSSAPKTPKPKPLVVASIQASASSTPMAHGCSTVSKLELDPDQPRALNSAKYEEFLTQDFERHRVFVDIDVFMERVLHVPSNWKEEWGSTIEAVKGDQLFNAAFQDYSKMCQDGVLEVKYYQPLVKIANAVFKVTESSPNKSSKPVTQLQYFTNDPKRIDGGVIAYGQSPDIVAVHKNFLPRMHPEEVENGCLDRTRLTWTQPLQLLEVKPLNGALVDGSYMPRLLVNGECTTISCDELP